MIEYEIKFLNIDKDKIRKRLKESGVKLIYPEYLQKRIIFNPPETNNSDRNWVRIRKEQDKTTMSFKRITNEKTIEGQEEIELEINDFEKAEKFLKAVGCVKKAYQENKRELWKIKDVDITIDEWPFLEPFIEIEGNSEREVKETVKLLGFDYSKGSFGSVSSLYKDKYNISFDKINNHTPLIIFNNKNPFS